MTSGIAAANTSANGEPRDHGQWRTEVRNVCSVRFRGRKERGVYHRHEHVSLGGNQPTLHQVTAPRRGVDKAVLCGAGEGRAGDRKMRGHGGGGSLGNGCGRWEEGGVAKGTTHADDRHDHCREEVSCAWATRETHRVQVRITSSAWSESASGSLPCPCPYAYSSSNAARQVRRIRRCIARDTGSGMTYRTRMWHSCAAPREYSKGASMSVFGWGAEVMEDLVELVGIAAHVLSKRSLIMIPRHPVSSVYLANFRLVLQPTPDLWLVLWPIRSVKIIWPRSDATIGPGADMIATFCMKDAGLSGFVSLEANLCEVGGFKTAPFCVCQDAQVAFTRLLLPVTVSLSVSPLCILTLAISASRTAAGLPLCPLTQRFVIASGDRDHIVASTTLVVVAAAALRLDVTQSVC
ncbi:hypothetical protein B0H21DRAFT_871531 [Amylocystis lapponica]|nr:hypothetical protein B0H21DRAFT_871531 [Amylocystis lapponica]